LRIERLPPLHVHSDDQRLTYTRAEFEAAFPEESSTVEFKTGTGRTPLQEALVAFTNTRGGVILIGVDDGGKVLGRRLGPGVEQDVLDAVAEAHEVLPPEMIELTVDGVHVVALSVAARPASVAQTSNGRVLVRRGARNRALFGAELFAFMQDHSHEPFDSTDARVRLADASLDLVAEFQALYGCRSDDLSDALREHGLLRQEGRSLTVCGALFLVDEPPRRFAKAEIEVRRFRDESSSYDVRDTVSGPLHRQVDAAMGLIERELGREIVLVGAFRQEVPRLPRDVIREALSNAVAHRRYDLTGQRTVVEIRPDRVVIRSPGGLVEGVRLDRLRKAQAARNDAIITVLRSFDLAEDSGKGVDLMEDEMSAALLEPPRFDADDDSFTVTLPLSAVVSREERAWVLGLEREGRIEGKDKVVVVHAARKGRINNGDVRKLTHSDSADVRQALRRLVDAGLLEMHGQKGGASYSLVSSFAAPTGARLDPVEAKRLMLSEAKLAPLTNARARALVGVDAITARALLSSLVTEGHLVPTGRTRDRSYSLADPTTSARPWPDA
jgi:ATP-dependent DNA helicase RecG